MAVAAHEIQGSDEWLEYRRTRGGASEVAALFECSPFEPKNARQLYEVKTGERDVFVSKAMRHGQQYEMAARAKLEEMLDEPLEPQVVEHPSDHRIIASLDGQSFDGATIVEIKCPPKGRQSDTWKHVEENGQPPQHYRLQIQQQLMCSGATYCLFSVYDADADEMITSQVHADPQTQGKIRDAWIEFFSHLDAGHPPDDGRREDDEWRLAVDTYKAAKAELDDAKAREQAAKETLEALAGEEGAEGCGVKVSRYWVKGSVDYKRAIPEGLDVEPFRKPGRWQTRVTVEKES